jgi:hypothetical protein
MPSLILFTFCHQSVKFDGPPNELKALVAAITHTGAARKNERCHSKRGRKQ